MTINIITGLPTRSVGDKYCFCFLSSVLVICNTPTAAHADMQRNSPGGSARRRASGVTSG